VQHQEPPEVAWLLPEDETGAALELMPEVPVEVEFDPDEPDPVEDLPDPVEEVPELGVAELGVAEDEEDDEDVSVL
jgi:hypothetical protein